MITSTVTFPECANEGATATVWRINLKDRVRLLLNEEFTWTLSQATAEIYSEFWYKSAKIKLEEKFL